MRIPPANVLCRPPTVDDVRRWPEFFIAGPGREVASRTECRHDYLLTSSCPGCDADADAAGVDTIVVLDESSPDAVTDVIAVYRPADSYSGFSVWVNGQFVATSPNYQTIVMQHVAHLGGQVVVRYEDDDSISKRVERNRRIQHGVIESGEVPSIVVTGEDNPLSRGAFWDGCGPADS
jgi:hypothetical protein